MIKPSRFLSNGRDAVDGSGFVDRAVFAQKPANAILTIGASAPQLPLHLHRRVQSL